jgi:tetratricopeptide (TPR) repeat protein
MAGIIAYSNTLHIPFHFDDIGVIVDNPLIKDLQYFVEPSKASDFKGTFGYHTFKTRYIVYLTFALNYKVHGLNTEGFHITNLLIHISTALFLYLLVILTFETPFLRESRIRYYSPYIAVFSSLLFACHPIQTEAVTYIWQRVASLATMLYVLSLVSYSKWRLSVNKSPVSGPYRFSALKSMSFYLISIIAAVLAMNTKQIAFTLPVSIALYEFMFFKERFKKRILFLIPLFLTMAIVPINLMDLNKPVGDLLGDVTKTTRYLTDMSRTDYLFTQFRSILTYIRLLVLPVNQNLDYDHPVLTSFFNPRVFLSFIFLVTVFCLGIFLLYRYRYSVTHVRVVSFGIFWFFITLAVESSIIPTVHVTCEYRMYLPSIGAFLAISTLIFMYVEKFSGKWNHTGRVVGSVLTLVVLVLTGATHARNAVWEDEVRLWSDVVRKSPGKARGHNNLCYSLNKQELYEKAIEHCRISIRLDPDYVPAYINLGNAYKAQGFVDEAIKEYQIAIKRYPSLSKAYYNLGIAYQDKGLVNAAIQQYHTAIKLNPGYLKAHLRLGKVYSSQGSVNRAIEHLRIASMIKPENEVIHYNLGIAYEKSEMYKEAINALKQAVRINPDHTEAYINLGVVYGKLKMYREAIDALKQAVRIKPDHAEAYINLGVAYGKSEMYRKAIDALNQAIKIKPDSAAIHYNLAVAYKREGLIEKADHHFEVAKKLKPDLF